MGEDINFEGGLTAPHRPRLRRIQGTRLRSRPDHLRLPQVGRRTGPAAGRSGKRRHHRLSEGGGRHQVQPVRRRTDQRRQRRRRRHLDHQGERRPQRLGRDRRADPADRRPGLQLAAGSGRPAAAGRTRRSQGRTLQGGQERPRRPLRRRRRHRPQDGGRTDDRSRPKRATKRSNSRWNSRSPASTKSRASRRRPMRSRWKRCSKTAGINPTRTAGKVIEGSVEEGLGRAAGRSRRRLGHLLLRAAAARAAALLARNTWNACRGPKPRPTCRSARACSSSEQVAHS